MKFLPLLLFVPFSLALNFSSQTFPPVLFTSTETSNYSFSLQHPIQVSLLKSDSFKTDIDDPDGLTLIPPKLKNLRLDLWTGSPRGTPLISSLQFRFRASSKSLPTRFEVCLPRSKMDSRRKIFKTKAFTGSFLLNWGGLTSSRPARSSLVHLRLFKRSERLIFLRISILFRALPSCEIVRALETSILPAVSRRELTGGSLPTQ